MIKYQARTRVHAGLTSFLLTATVSSWGAAQDDPVADPATESAPPPVVEPAPVAEPAPAPAAVAPAPAAEPEIEEPSKNAVFLEGLGAGIFYSLNYERQLVSDLGLRVGVGFLSFGVNDGSGGGASASLVTIPIHATYIGVRGGMHAFEVGGGPTIVYAGAGASTPGSGSSSADSTNVWLSANAGYRLHPLGGPGFQLRAGLSIMAALGEVTAVFPWPYLSVGAAF